MSLRDGGGARVLRAKEGVGCGCCRSAFFGIIGYHGTVNSAEFNEVVDFYSRVTTKRPEGFLVSCRGLIILVLALALVGNLTALGYAQSRPSDRDFEDAFMLFEKSELIDDVIKEGDKFNLAKELRDLQQKYERTFGREMPEQLWSEFDRGVRDVWAMPPEARPPRKKALPPSPELFFAEERVRVLSKTRREGNGFDASKELAKLAEKYESRFGVPMPGELKDRYLQDAQTARALVPGEPGSSDDSRKKERDGEKPRTPSSTASIALRQIRSFYLDGLPDWFRQRDQNQDGQLGLYEWPRSQVDEFRRFDLNRDGFLVQAEVLRTLGVTTRPTTPTARSSDVRRSDRR